MKTFKLNQLMTRAEIYYYKRFYILLTETYINFMH